MNKANNDDNDTRDELVAVDSGDHMNQYLLNNDMSKSTIH